MLSSKEEYTPLSFSSLKAYSRSPLAFLHYKLAPRKETAAMTFGTLVHRAILEPDKYEQSTVIWDGRRAGNKYLDFKEDNADKDILTPKEALDIRLIANRVLDHPYAGPMVRQCKDFEKPFEIEQCGIPHRGIIDGLGEWFILDLKTTQNVSHHSLQRTIYDFKYYMQAAIYQRAAELMGMESSSYFILAVESGAPHHVQVVELEPHYIARGHLEWERLLRSWKAWDGKSAHGHEGEDGWMMDAPHWAPAMEINL